MNLLLDTHIWLWWLLDDPRLTTKAKALIADPNNRVSVSTISVWEVNIKIRVGKLKVEGDLIGSSRDTGLEFISFEVKHAQEVASLLPHHRDPFDPALLAQARSERLALMTVDSDMALYKDQVNLIQF